MRERPRFRELWHTPYLFTGFYTGLQYSLSFYTHRRSSHPKSHEREHRQRFFTTLISNNSRFLLLSTRLLPLLHVLGWADGGGRAAFLGIKINSCMKPFCTPCTLTQQGLTGVTCQSVHCHAINFDDLTRKKYTQPYHSPITPLSPPYHPPITPHCCIF